MQTPEQENDATRAAFHAFLYGRVQGVGCRASVRAQARRLKLVGWVQNVTDGGVEILAEGEETTLKTFEAWLRASPPGSSIERVDLRYCTPTYKYITFSITY